MENKKDLQRELNLLNKEIDSLYRKKEKLIYEINRLHLDDNIDKYLRDYKGKELLKKHTILEVGDWEILSEDENGYVDDYCVKIGEVTGTLEDAIKWAYNKNRHYYRDWMFKKKK